MSASVALHVPTTLCPSECVEMVPVAVEGPATLATSAANHLLFICVNEKMFHVPYYANKDGFNTEKNR